MFPEMRRKKLETTEEQAFEIVRRCNEGILGTIGINGYPHTVPVNYVVWNNKIYIHSAKEGFKISNIKSNNKVSFTVYDDVQIIPERFTTNYQSVMIYGQANIIPGNKEVLQEFIRKYAKPFLQEGIEYVQKSFDTTDLIEITIEHITGKQHV